ncbi:MAG: hypothetical protein EPN22_11140 [Nitrospirae bacterium]|nr:MAG: hypothetical protein EPN22_11140 [Nitrospirota bacterium]
MAYTVDTSINAGALSAFMQQQAVADSAASHAKSISGTAQEQAKTASQEASVQGKSEAVSVIYKEGTAVLKFQDSKGRVVMQIPSDEYLILRSLAEDKEKKLSITVR